MPLLGRDKGRNPRSRRSDDEFVVFLQGVGILLTSAHLLYMAYLIDRSRPIAVGKSSKIWYARQPYIFGKPWYMMTAMAPLLGWDKLLLRTKMKHGGPTVCVI